MFYYFSFLIALTVHPPDLLGRPSELRTFHKSLRIFRNLFLESLKVFKSYKIYRKLTQIF